MSYIVSAVLLVVAMETSDVRWCYAAAAFCIAGRMGDWIEAWKEKKKD